MRASVTVSELDSYEAIKRTLLVEFKLTPRDISSRLVYELTSELMKVETSLLLDLTIDSCIISEAKRRIHNDVKRIIELLVENKLKALLPLGALR